MLNSPDMRDGLPGLFVVLFGASGCGSTAGPEAAVLLPEPVPAPSPPGAPPEAAPRRAAEPPDAAPGASVSDTAHERCMRLADRSGWVCSPAAASPEELGTLVAAVIAREMDPQGSVRATASEVARAEGELSSSVALVQIDVQDGFGDNQAVIALAGHGGWGYAADAGVFHHGVNSDGSARFVGARRDATTGLVVADVEWEGSDAACTEPLSWTFDELRSTVCDPNRLLCRTVPTERTTVEERYDAEGIVTRRRTVERFRARLLLDARGRLQLRTRAGRPPRGARPLARPTRLALVDVGIDPFAR